MLKRMDKCMDWIIFNEHERTFDVHRNSGNSRVDTIISILS